MLLRFRRGQFLPLLCLLWLGLWAPSVFAEECETVIEVFLEADAEQTVPKLKDVIVDGVLQDTPITYQAFFNKSQTDYYDKVDFKKLEKLFRKVAEKGLKGAGEKEREKLIDLRFIAQTLRGSYHLYSRGHTSPELFRKFVRDFGYMNDALYEGKDKRARKMARKVLEYMQQGGHDTKKLGFTPAEPGAIARYAATSFDWIEAQLGKPIDIHAYHDVRKKIRDFKVFAAYLKKKFPGSAYVELGKRAARISKTMGENKNYIFQVLKLGDEDRVQIDASLTAEIRAFVKDFRRLYGITPVPE